MLKNFPLSNLMNSIARVMKFKWEIGNKDTTPTYRLFMDRKSLLDAEAQNARRDARILQQRSEQRVTLFESFNRLRGENFA